MRGKPSWDLGVGVRGAWTLPVQELQLEARVVQADVDGTAVTTALAGLTFWLRSDGWDTGSQPRDGAHGFTVSALGGQSWGDGDASAASKAGLGWKWCWRRGGLRAEAGWQRSGAGLFERDGPHVTVGYVFRIGERE